MKKWNEDGMMCSSCYGNKDSCTSYRLQLGLINKSKTVCGDNSYKYYSNILEVERLLRLWDDANGSIAEWRKNDRGMLELNDDGLDCDSCMGHDVCESWVCECGGRKWCGIGGYKSYYANKQQTEALLKWHDDRFGKIVEKEKAVDDMDDMNFRVGDAVSFVTTENGRLTHINNEELRGEFPSAIINFRKSKNGDYRCGDYTLYHGHDPKVTVEEEKPVRTVEKWLTVFLNDKTLKTEIVLRDHDEHILSVGENIKIYGPVKVQISK